MPFTNLNHHFDTSGTSNALFDELAERSLMRPLVGTKHMYVRLAIIIHCKILALFSNFLQLFAYLETFGNRHEKADKQFLLACLCITKY